MTQFATSSDIMTRWLNQVAIGQRIQDGYVDATALCQAASKRMGNYLQNHETKEFLVELAGSAGIPADLLVQTIATGPNEQRGTWVHPQVAIHLAMWCSPVFAVQVVRWVELWFRTRHNPMEAPLQPYHDFLRLIREVKAVLEELGMYEPPDQLRLADTVRNVLMAAHGQLQLPAHRGHIAEVLSEEGRMWSVGERLIERGYPTRYAKARDERGHGYLVRIGKIMSQKFQRRHARPPLRASRYVDGAVRKVCIYPDGDLDLLDVAIEEVVGPPPAIQTT